MENTHPRRCIAHTGTCTAHSETCIVLWAGYVSEITVQMLGGIDRVKISTPLPWKKRMQNHSV